jgi:hypothetical protein
MNRLSTASTTLTQVVPTTSSAKATPMCAPPLAASNEDPPFHSILASTEKEHAGSPPVESSGMPTATVPNVSPSATLWGSFTVTGHLSSKGGRALPTAKPSSPQSLPPLLTAAPVATPIFAAPVMLGSLTLVSNARDATPDGGDASMKRNELDEATLAGESSAAQAPAPGATPSPYVASLPGLQSPSVAVDSDESSMAVPAGHTFSTSSIDECGSLAVSSSASPSSGSGDDNKVSAARDRTTAREVATRRLPDSTTAALVPRPVTPSPEPKLDAVSSAAQAGKHEPVEPTESRDFSDARERTPGSAQSPSEAGTAGRRPRSSTASQAPTLNLMSAATTAPSTPADLSGTATPQTVGPAVTTDNPLTPTTHSTVGTMTAAPAPGPLDRLNVQVSSANLSVIHQAAHGEIDLPELGRVSVSARGGDSGIDVRVAAGRTAATELLLPHAVAMEAEVRSANVPLHRLEISSHGLLNGSTTDAGTSSRRESGGREPGAATPSFGTGNRQNSEDAAPVRARVRIVL